MSDDNQKPLNVYRRLLSAASELERMAGEESFGGPTFWGRVIKDTGHAIAGAKYSDIDRAARGLSWEQFEAVAIVGSRLLDPIWLAAAGRLRAQAAASVGALEAQVIELQKLIAELKANQPT